MKYYIKIPLIAVVTILITAQIVSAQNHLTGTVTSSEGTPLQGVKISSKNITNIAATDGDGYFNIKSENMPITLTFEHKDYRKKERTFLRSQSQVTVNMKQELFSKKVAYGEQKKENITSAISTISGDELVKNRSANLLTALQQRLPGLRIIQNDGTPGGETYSSHIRGFDSPNSNQILFLVDGIERDPSGIDPHAVKTVSVLKDGAATSMYGMRGSGGVILINTKEGFNGSSKINVSIDQAMQTSTRLPEFTSAYDYARLYNQGLANDTMFTGQTVGADQFYSANEIEHYRLADSTSQHPVRNMMDDFIKDFSNLTRLNMNFQGGTDIMKYFTSVSYMNQGGIFKNQPFDQYSYDAESKSNRFNFRTNLDLEINETIGAWAKIGGYIQKNNGPVAGIGSIIAKLYETPNNAHNNLTPQGEVLVERDRLNYRTSESVFGLLNRTGVRNQTVTRLNNTFGGRKDLGSIVQGLSAQAQLSFDIFSRNTVIRQRNYAAFETTVVTSSSGADSLAYAKVPGTNNTNLNNGQSRFFNYGYNARASIDFARIFDDRHNVTAKLLGERNFQQKQALVPKNYLGLAGRATYAYDSRYLLEANFAYQGSEQFAPGKRYGFFPSVSLGWIVSNESFLQNSNVLSFLKLRASAGQTGNDVFQYGADNQYLYISTWNNNATQDQIGNPNIQWETITKYNLGLETELYSKLSLGVDLFYHEANDIMIRDISIIPDGMMGLGGASLPPANLGSSENRGFEVYAGYENQFSKDFDLNINGSLSYSKSENTYSAELPFNESYAYEFRRQGYPIGQRWGYQTAGLFDSQEEIDNWADQTSFGGEPIPGDIKYVDLTGDGKVDEKDLAPIAESAMPNLLLGFNTSARFKNVDLSIFINGSFQRDVFLHGFGRWNNRDNITEYMRDEAWTPERSSNRKEINYPRLGNSSPNYTMNSFWIEDGSYIRVRNVELGYSLPQSVVDKVNIQNIRLYVNGLNVFTWDKLPNDDFDPETSNGANNNHPIIKAYNFGVNIDF